MPRRAVLTSILLFTISVGVAYAANEIRRSVIASGGGLASSTSHDVVATIGQDVIGVVSSANHTIRAGFWVVPSSPTGDLNCDGVFNGGDIGPFFLALGNPSRYLTSFPDCDITLADINCDGFVNGGDIDPFFNCLGAGNCSCP